jgi:hypothetical protein
VSIACESGHLDLDLMLQWLFVGVYQYANLSVESLTSWLKSEWLCNVCEWKADFTHQWTDAKSYLILIIQTT